MEYHNAVSEVEGDREIELKKGSHCEKLETARVQCQDFIDPTQIYEDLHAVGLEFRDNFRCIKDARSRSHQSLGTICIPDTASLMPNKLQIPHVLHPATLDACMQMTSVALVKAGALHSPMVPTFTKELRISHDVPKEPGNKLLVHCSSTVVGKRSSTSSISATHSTEAVAQLPSLEIKDLSARRSGQVLKQRLGTERYATSSSGSLLEMIGTVVVTSVVKNRLH